MGFRLSPSKKAVQTLLLTVQIFFVDRDAGGEEALDALELPETRLRKSRKKSSLNPKNFFPDVLNVCFLHFPRASRVFRRGRHEREQG
jgi:hypothetical protein